MSIQCCHSQWQLYDFNRPINFIRWLAALGRELSVIIATRSTTVIRKHLRQHPAPFRSVKFVFNKKTFEVSGTQQRASQTAQMSLAVVCTEGLGATLYMAFTRTSEECDLNNAPTASRTFAPTKALRPGQPADGRQQLRRLRRQTGPAHRSTVPSQEG